MMYLFSLFINKKKNWYNHCIISCWRLELGLNEAKVGDGRVAYYYDFSF